MKIPFDVAVGHAVRTVGYWQVRIDALKGTAYPTLTGNQGGQHD